MLPDNIGYVILKQKVRESLLILNSSMFQKIVERGLVRVARTRLDVHTKTVEHGALFFQELLPEYTVLITAVLKSIRFQGEINSLIGILNNNIIILGGDETVGRGIVRIKLI